MTKPDWLTSYTPMPSHPIPFNPPNQTHQKHKNPPHSSLPPPSSPYSLPSPIFSGPFFGPKEPKTLQFHPYFPPFGSKMFEKEPPPPHALSENKVEPEKGGGIHVVAMRVPRSPEKP